MESQKNKKLTGNSANILEIGFFCIFAVELGRLFGQIPFFIKGVRLDKSLQWLIYGDPIRSWPTNIIVVLFSIILALSAERLYQKIGYWMSCCFDIVVLLRYWVTNYEVILIIKITLSFITMIAFAVDIYKELGKRNYLPT